MNQNNLEIQTKYINQKNTFTGKEINKQIKRNICFPISISIINKIKNKKIRKKPLYY